MRKLLPSVIICSSLLFTSCATTTAPTESSTETIDKTTNAALDMTSSTSPGSSDFSAQATAFTEKNYASVRRDIGRGKGEHLEALGELLGVAPEALETFCRLNKQNYEKLYGKGDISAAELVASLQEDAMHLAEQALITGL